MELIFLLPSLENVGPINVAFDILKNQKASDKKIVISFKSGNRIAEFEEFATVIVTKNLFRIMQIFKQYPNGVFHSHCLLPDLVNAICGIKRKTVTTLHNDMNKDYIILKGKIIGNLMCKIHSFALSNLTLRIACSKNVSESTKYCDGYINNGVRNRANNLNFEIDYIDSRKFNPRFVYLGSLYERKNLKVALEVFSKHKYSSIDFWVIGDGPLKEIYIQEYGNCKNIKFMGHIEDPWEFVNECDVYVSSSLSEGMPLSFLETLSCGLTYLVSRIPSHSYVHNLSTSSGFIHDNTVHSFMSGLNSILSLKREDLEQRKNICIDLYDNNFTEVIMSDSYRENYEVLVHG